MGQRKEFKPAAAEIPEENILPVRECLQGIVHLHPKVETLFCPQKGCLLSWVNQADPAKQSWWRALLSGSGRRHQLTLDPLGRKTIELIDGRRNVDLIATLLAEEFGLDPDKAKAALIVFLTRLMQKNIVQVVRGGGEWQ